MRNLLWRLLMPEKVEYVRIHKGIVGLLLNNGGDWHKVRRLSKIMNKTFTELNEVFYPEKSVKMTRMFGWKCKVWVCIDKKLELCEVFENKRRLFIEA